MSPSEETTAPVPETTKPYVEPTSVRILAIGDMLMHAGISHRASLPDGGYDYSYLFDNIREDLQSADLRIVNNEVIFGGDELGPVGYPLFSVPTALGDSERAEGFNVILGATNHSNDQGPQGILNTLNYWSQFPEVTLLGLHASQEAYDEPTIIEKNGIRIGLINLTYGLNMQILEPENQYLVEMMTQENRYRIADKIRRTKENSDFVIVFPHWGEEHELTHNQNQQEWAEFFAEFGADLIIGSHTHTVQESEWVTAWNGNSAYCVYSLGNFVSLQAMTINMVGKMPIITILKDTDGCRIVETRNEYLMTWFSQGFGDIRVYKMNQVTEEILAEDAVVGSVDNPYYNEMNQYFPLTMDVLHSLCK